jgi:hypothetical protein
MFTNGHGGALFSERPQRLRQNERRGPRPKTGPKSEHAGTATLTQNRSCGDFGLGRLGQFFVVATAGSGRPQRRGQR